MATLLERAHGHLELANPGRQRMCGIELESWWANEVAPYFAAPDAVPFPFLRPE